MVWYIRFDWHCNQFYRGKFLSSKMIKQKTTHLDGSYELTALDFETNEMMVIERKDADGRKDF